MRLNKRDFVKGAAASVVVAASVRAAGIIHETFDIVVYNDWFPQARTFAATLSEQGTRALPVAGDAGVLWYGTLRGLIADGRRRIAGLTTHTDLLILETLATHAPQAQTLGLRVYRRENIGRLVSWVLI